MNYSKVLRCFFVLYLVTVFSQAALSSGEQLSDPSTYIPKIGETGKKNFDDPNDLNVTQPLKDFLPSEIWNAMIGDLEKMKNDSAELLGYTAPDLVGNIAPEIKPGKYTYKDLERYPGLKELFPPLVVEHFIKPGGPPFEPLVAKRTCKLFPTRHKPFVSGLLRAIGVQKPDARVALKFGDCCIVHAPVGSGQLRVAMPG